MSISSELYKVNVVGDGSTPTIAFNRKVFNSTDIKGIKYDTTTSVETALVNGTDFTVSGAGETSSSVTITPSAAIPTGTNWVLYSDAGSTQSITLTTAGEFPAKSLEYAFDKLAIGTQEADGKADRALKLPISDTASADLPNKTDRASKVLGFDASGNPTAYAQGTSSNADGITYDQGGTGSSATTVQAKLQENVSVKDFGAKGDGSTDDTTAIEAAWAYVTNTTDNYYPIQSGQLPFFVVNGPTLYFPAGDYIYNGTGLTISTSTTFRIIGDGRGSTRIQVADGYYLIDASSYINSMEIRDLHIEGGKGLFRNTYTNINVSGQHLVKDCFLSNYTACAIGHNSSDMPYWFIENNVFDGTQTSTAVALSGLANSTRIVGNAFLTNLYGIKLGKGGADVRVENNDFVHFENGGNSPNFTNIWIVPTTSFAGQKGATIFNNKFGNENLSSGDYKILIADEASAGNFPETAHATSASTGLVEALDIRDNQFAGNSGYTRPYIVSYTPNIRNCQLGPNFLLGTQPDNYIEFPAADLVENRNRECLIDVGPTNEGPNKLNTAITSSGNLGLIRDPLGYHSGEMNVPNYHTAGGASADYVNLLTADDVTTDGSVGSGSRAGITDALGGSNAIEFTVSGNGGGLNFNGLHGSLVPGRVSWVELDILKSSSTPLDEIYLSIWKDASTVAYQRYLRMPDSWQTVRFTWIPNETYSTNLQLRVTEGDYAAGTKTKFKIGRPRLYHAAEPVNFSRLSAGITQTTVGAAGAASTLPANPTGYTTVLINGTEYVMPYYAKS